MRIHNIASLVALVGLLPICVSAQPVGTTGLRPLPLEAAADVVSVESPVTSPGGTWVAYQISDPRRQIPASFDAAQFSSTGLTMAFPNGLSLRIFQVASGRTVTLTGATGSTWGPAWSPDGRRLAFYSDRTGKATLWVWDSVTNASRQVSQEIVHPFFPAEIPVWSRDGKHILVKLIPQGMTVQQLLEATPGYPQPASAGNQNAAKVDVYTYHPSLKQSTASASPAASDMKFADARFLSDLALIGVSDGSVKRVAQRVRPGWYALSPDDRSAAYMQMQGWLPNTQQPVFDLRVIALNSGTQRTLVSGLMDGYATGVSWSPDSRYLAYQTAGQKADNALYLLDVASGQSTKLAGPLRSVDTDDFEKAGLWSDDSKSVYTIDEITGKVVSVSIGGGSPTELGIIGGAILDIYRGQANRSIWSPDGGRSIVVQVRNAATKSVTLCRFNLQAQTCSAVLDRTQQMSLGSAPATGTTTSPIGYLGRSATDPGSVYITNAAFGDALRISNTNEAILQSSLGQAKLIDFTSRQGEHLRAALLLPANYVEGKRYPLVVRVYGGEMGSDDVNKFGMWGSPFAEFNSQVLASRGYAVVEPDVPVHDNLHQPMQDVYDAVMPAIDRVIDLGIADPNKIGVMGQSFGGYNTIALITQTTRFAAAVATAAGPTDLFEAYAEFDSGSDSTGYYETGQGDMGCTPWECRDRYLSNSPSFFLDKVQTPLLMARGSLDQISVQNGETFVGLRRLGKDVTLLEYAGEGHGLERPANIVDFWTRTLAFLNQHMGP